ncbi:MAG: thioredoxin family protein [Pseudomonadota bacterium]
MIHCRFSIHRLCQALAFTCLLSALPGALRAEGTGYSLVMVDQPGCFYCIRWREEIGPAYPNTEFGAYAPLRNVQLRDIPEDLSFERRVLFTPTFIVVDGAGVEVGRLEGYPGEDFFWPMLERVLAETTPFEPVPPLEN